MIPLRSWLIPRLYWAGKRARLAGRTRTAKGIFQATVLLEPRTAIARRELATLRKRPAGWPERVRFVILGTTGTCNASCVHCPTGKATTAHNPRAPMPMPMFRNIIDAIVDYRLPVDGHIAFGLFGDGLVDPFVIERAEYLRARLPEVILSVNTNGAAFNKAKHARLNELASIISLHCESLDAATYDDLMRPLRAERVFPKYQEMLDAFPGKLAVSVPITRRNVREAPTIRDYFLSRGAHDVHFDPIMSRCAEDRSVFEALALAPQRMRCSADVADDLIVDCDGTVLQCCQDFQRLEPIGNLNQESVAEALLNLHRQTMRRQMQEMAHDQRVTCTRCFADVRTPNFPFDAAA